MKSLSGKVVVVTGASSGIGHAVAQEALKQGALVACCARDVQKLTENITLTPNSFLYQADVTIAEQCKAFIEAVIAKWGRVDVLVCNAGISMRALFADADLTVLHRLMDTNFWGMVNCVKYAETSIVAHKGVIVGVSSIAGYRGLPARTGYSASKFAMQGFLEALRTELLYSGAHVMWVSPGFTASNIRNVALSGTGNAQTESPLDEKKLMSAEQCAKIIIEGIVKRKRTVVMTGEGRLTMWLNRVLPSFTDRQVYKRFYNEPGSPLADK